MVTITNLITHNVIGCNCYDSIIHKEIFIDSGIFPQGSINDSCRWSDETQFTHTLSWEYLVMETEVTRQMWAELKAVQPSLPPDPSNVAISPSIKRPVQNATWFEALLFANLLSIQAGLPPCYFKDAGFTVLLDATNYTTGDYFCRFSSSGFRLPTEGEWEYFARADTITPFSIAEANYNASTCDTCSTTMLTSLESVSTFCVNADGTTGVAGIRAANPWGLKDMHGNVWEWCWDWYSDIYPSGSIVDYSGPTTGVHRSFRGGSWYSTAKSFRSANRGHDTPNRRLTNLGFRLIRTNSPLK
jgi:formylglycine-generating enzyme required for sulfatase activity